MGRTMTLGSLIDGLQKLNLTLPVYFNNGQHPTSLDSWRGIYAELALSHECTGEVLSGVDILNILKDADGKSFTGYKGGAYEMDSNTQVWVDNYSEYTCTAIVGIKQKDDQIIIKTKRESNR